MVKKNDQSEASSVPTRSVASANMAPHCNENEWASVRRLSAVLNGTGPWVASIGWADARSSMVIGNIMALVDRLARFILSSTMNYYSNLSAANFGFVP